ncbi:MAG: hypothetical protein IPK87_09420 [Planctomycetes bacterium]|nr:hypothetical protein [Planctomycetota bacterium]
MNEQHRELLSAWLDGELTAAEQSAIKDLLQRDDAKAYIAELEQTRMLVTRHAMVKAPADLASRVLARIGEGSGGAGRVAAIHQLPTANWRTPLYAIAAALVVALGIMFGPALISPKPEAPRDVAREVIENSKRGGDLTADKPPGTKSDAEGEYGEDREELLRRATDDLKLKREGSKGDTWGENSDEVNDDPADLPKMARSAKPGTGAPANAVPPSAPADEEPRKNAKTGKTDGAGKVGEKSGEDLAERERAEEQNDGANSEAGEPAPKDRDSGKKLEGAADADDAKESKDANKDPKTDAKEEAKHGDPAKSETGPREDRGNTGRTADKGADDTGGGSGGSSGKATGGGASRGQSQPERAAERPTEEQGATPPAPQPAEADAEAHVVVLQADEALAAQNDVLWIASLYGAATLNDEDAGTESVSVDLPEDQLEALLKAIRRLAGDQDYTTVAGPGAEAKEPAADAGKISGYLPGKKTEANAQAQARTVRVVVKFK